MMIAWVYYCWDCDDTVECDVRRVCNDCGSDDCEELDFDAVERTADI